MKVVYLTTFLAIISFIPRFGETISEAAMKVQVLQNQVADEENLSRMKSLSMIRSFVDKGWLVPLTPNGDLRISASLPRARWYVRPWVNDFLRELASDFHLVIGERLKIPSAVRTFTSQLSLRKRNPYAVGVKGWYASSHLTGSTVDISTFGLDQTQILWLRNWLETRTGLIVWREPHCVHVMVSKYYGQTEAHKFEMIQNEAEWLAAKKSIGKKATTRKKSKKKSYSSRQRRKTKTAIPKSRSKNSRSADRSGRIFFAKI